MGTHFFRSRTVVGTVVGSAVGLAVGIGISVAGSPTAAAAALPAFGGCDDLLRWYVDRALPRVGPYGLDGGPVVYGATEDSAAGPGWAAQGSGAAGSPVAPGPAAHGADQSQVSSGTGTNVQEAGVDEPDLAKTDGHLVVRVRGDRLLVTRVGDGRVGAVPDVGAVGLPDDLRASELLLSGTRVLVVGSSYPVGVPMPPLSVAPSVPKLTAPEPSRGLTSPGLPGPDQPVPVPEPAPRSFLPPLPPFGSDSSRVIEVDLTDPAAPRVLSDRTYGGRLVSARQYDGTGAPVVRLVLHTGAPTLDFVQPNRDRSPDRATEQNRRIVRESTISDWLPQVHDAAGGGEQPLLHCDEVRHPRAQDVPRGDLTGPAAGIGWPDLGTLSIVTLPFSNPTTTSATAVTTSADTVYSSKDRLYLALTGPSGTTKVHAYALEGTGTRYVASGSVKGLVRDRWSMDEHGGVLRMAVGLGDWKAADNAVVTLREDGDRLVQLGSVRGLGPDEEIRSVRWFDDLAVVVTFRQTDPLYTVDLRDPAAPRTLGALKIPGFSAYLHPLGGGRLLGIGQDADLSGMTRGTQASVFDVSDLARPRRLSVLPVDDALVAEQDPRALTWIPTDRAGGVVLAGASRSDGGLAVLELRVGADGSLSRGSTWPLGPAFDVRGPVTPRALPLGDGRVALVGSSVSVVRVG